MGKGVWAGFCGSGNSVSLGSSEFDADARAENNLDGGVVVVLFVASEAELFNHPVTLIVEVGEALEMGEYRRMSRSRVGSKGGVFGLQAMDPERFGGSNGEINGCQTLWLSRGCCWVSNELSVRVEG